MNPTPPGGQSWRESLHGYEEDPAFGPIRHDPLDDATADRILNHLLRAPDSQRWAIMLSERYAEQTARVLRFFAAQSGLAHEARAAEVRDARLAHEAHELGAKRLRTIEKQHAEWLHTVRYFENLVSTWIDKAEAAALIARAAVRGPLDELLDAVDAHQRGTLGLGSADKPDRMLWKAAEKVRGRVRATPTSRPVDRTPPPGPYYSRETA